MITRLARHRAIERTYIKLHWQAIRALRGAFGYANDNRFTSPVASPARGGVAADIPPVATPAVSFLSHGDLYAR